MLFAFVIQLKISIARQNHNLTDGMNGGIGITIRAIPHLMLFGDIKKNKIHKIGEPISALLFYLIKLFRTLIKPQARRLEENKNKSQLSLPLCKLDVLFKHAVEGFQCICAPIGTNADIRL